MTEYMSAAGIAARWGVSERSVRGYCAAGRVPGAFRTGRAWAIPADAAKPQRANARPAGANPLLERLRDEKAASLRGGIYHRVQIELTYNSNRIEGSHLSHEQTRMIFETSTVGAPEAGASVRVDDIIETVNHFRAVDYIIEHAERPVSEAMFKELHGILKASTTDASRDWFAVGAYKLLPNEVGDRMTTLPEDVPAAMHALLEAYGPGDPHALEDIIAFHVALERIHPFQDGNGRVGRLVMFKECLANGIVPFVIADDMKAFYYRGLSEWDNERGFLMDTCLAAQDRFATWLDYFRVARCSPRR